MTGLDLVSSAMRLIGALGSGETPTASEAQDALACLNGMLDSWLADRLMAFSITIQEFPLTPGKQVYKYGPSLDPTDFVGLRPSKINSVSIVSLNNPQQPLELEIDYYSDADWQALPVKTGIPGPLAQGIYDDGNFPARGITVWPVPSVAANIRFYVWQQLTSFPDLNTPMSFPPGYREALRYNLANRLIAEFPGEYAQITVATTAQLAVESLARVKVINMPVIQNSIDPFLLGGGGKASFYTDTIVRIKN